MNINRKEMEYAVGEMKNNKVTGVDDTPVEVWKDLGHEEINILWGIQQENIPAEWTKSVVVPVYKEKVMCKSVKTTAE